MFPNAPDLIVTYNLAWREEEKELMKRCYRGCPNRRKHVWVRCENCKKEEYKRKKRSEWYLIKRDLENALHEKVAEH